MHVQNSHARGKFWLAEDEFLCMKNSAVIWTDTGSGVNTSKGDETQKQPTLLQQKRLINVC